MLENINCVLAAFGQKPLQRIAQLYQEVDQNFLTTFAEFDPYPTRQNAEYWGPMLLSGGKPPCWPEGRGKRIYAYLKPFPALPRLLALLGELGCPTLIYGDGIHEQFSAPFPATNLRFERERLDMSEVARQCDLAILNGTPATTLAMLLAGKPSLQIPIYLEQALNARVVAQLGLGLAASPERPEQIAASLTSLLQDDRYAEAAREFAARHADFDPQRQIASDAGTGGATAARARRASLAPQPALGNQVSDVVVAPVRNAGPEGRGRISPLTGEPGGRGHDGLGRIGIEPGAPPGKRRVGDDVPAAKRHEREVGNVPQALDEHEPRVAEAGLAPGDVVGEDQEGGVRVEACRGLLVVVAGGQLGELPTPVAHVIGAAHVDRAGVPRQQVAKARVQAAQQFGMGRKDLAAPSPRSAGYAALTGKSPQGWQAR